MHFVNHDWFADQLDTDEVVVVDPRLRVRYTSGHLPGAVHVPVRKAMDAAGALRPEQELAAWFGSQGVSNDDRPVLVYDDRDGQAGPLLAWLLEYLGHQHVYFLLEPIETWRALGGECRYRPVVAREAGFRLDVQTGRRALFTDVSSELRTTSMIDARSPEEFRGHRTLGEDLPGHIPGAANIPWTGVLGQGPELFVSPDDLGRLVNRTNLRTDPSPIVYCRSGFRASTVAVALEHAGIVTRLYDGSWLDWSQHRSQTQR